MFSVERRAQLLSALVDAARADEGITAAALVGSLARGTVDRWSDVDLALRLAPGADLEAVRDRWSELLQRLGPVADRLDIAAAGASYRVFLLDDSLQVDLSFWPEDTFAPIGGEPFEVLFGASTPPLEPQPVDARTVLRWGWLYALHARSALRRGRSWQALQMVDGVRDQLIALACLRHGLPPFEGRGVDRLPETERARLVRVLAGKPEAALLQSALTCGVRLLQGEARVLDPAFADRPDPALEVLQER